MNSYAVEGYAIPASRGTRQDVCLTTLVVQLISVIVLSAVDHGLESPLDLTKVLNIDIWCFRANHSTLRRTSGATCRLWNFFSLS
jgi:hypothetical protein